MYSRLQQVNRIIISIGHERGVDPGAVNSKGEKEVDQNLRIAAELAAELVQRKIFCLLVPDLSLGKTCEYINRVGNSYTDVAIEIHKDSVGKGYSAKNMHRRMGIYAHPESTQSFAIARVLQERFIKAGAHQSTWIRSDVESNHRSLAFIRRPKMLSYIIECGFIEGDNSDAECKFYANTIADAIEKILTK